MLDRDGFRPNVGIILLNQKNQVFWGKRIRTHSWQFPQGGIDRGETPEQAMFRELHEEVGLQPEHVRLSPAPATGCATRCLTGISAAMRAALQGPEADLVSAATARHDWDLNLRATNHPSSTPGAGTTIGCRWMWWWSSNAASTRWRSPNSRASCPATSTAIATFAEACVNATRGIRCSAGQHRVYARHNATGGWSVLSGSEWQPMYGSAASRHALALSLAGVCKDRAVNRSASNIVRTLKSEQPGGFD
jgi:hypothetical protein